MLLLEERLLLTTLSHARSLRPSRTLSDHLPLHLSFRPACLPPPPTPPFPAAAAARNELFVGRNMFMDAEPTATRHAMRAQRCIHLSAATPFTSSSFAPSSICPRPPLAYMPASLP